MSGGMAAEHVGGDGDCDVDMSVFVDDLACDAVVAVAMAVLGYVAYSMSMQNL